jgi:hypothetical protein
MIIFCICIGNLSKNADILAENFQILTLAQDRRVRRAPDHQRRRDAAEEREDDDRDRSSRHRFENRAALASSSLVDRKKSHVAAEGHS